MEAALYKEEACVGLEKAEWPYHRSCGDMAGRHAVRIVEQVEVEPVAGSAEGHTAEVDFTFDHPLDLCLSLLLMRD